MSRALLIIGVLYSLSHAKEFRFDYEFSEQAGGWLKLHVVPATWDEARLRCHAEGAVLASPLTDKLKEAIQSFVKTKSCVDHEGGLTIYLGVHATFSKGDYSSVEGVPLLRLAIRWARGEPDNFDNSESCLAMMISSGTAADTRCDNVLPYVCYKKDEPLIITQCGTSDTEYILEPRTGSCYKFHKTGLLWSQAYMTCVAEGGYLAIINNYLEAQVMREIFSRHPENTLFTNYKGSLMIGFHDWGQCGASFMTIHGESLEDNYNNWSPGQPDNEKWHAKPHKGVAMGGNIFRNGLLDDIYTNIPLVFLCEKEPSSLH